MAAAYAAACIELFSRLWAELEQRSTSEFSASPTALAGPAFDAGEALRIELVLLLEACDSPLWQDLLSPQQRRSLRSTLERALGSLTNGAVQESLERAQDSLLDEVLNHCETLGYRSQTGWPREWKRWATRHIQVAPQQSPARTRTSTR
jgi:hypothetical protein